MGSEQCEDFRNEFLALRASVHGNGRPGLLSDVRILQEQMMNQQKSQADTNGRLARIERMLYIAVGLGMALQIGLKFLVK